MNKAELVFVPAPGIGHLVSTVEFAKCLLNRDERLSVTVLVMRPPSAPAIDAYIQSLVTATTGSGSGSGARIKYIPLPPVDPPSDLVLKSIEKAVSVFIERHKSHVKDAILKRISSPVAGLVVDLFCTSMIDVADELGIPPYLFFTSSAAFLGFMLHLPTRHAQIGREFSLSDPPSSIPTYANTLSAGVLPSFVFNKEGGYSSFLHHGTRFRETKGIFVNTFAELETHAVRSLTSSSNSGEIPPIYAVGPLLDLNKKPSKPGEGERILKWLDNQPSSSVVFLCFGSQGGFEPLQLAQMAIALERSGHRFLWSIRNPRPKGDGNETTLSQTEYTNFGEVLPDGFLERTQNRGMVCGWAPQVEILAHESIGGFVSHCGWNSILESLWYGVPIATWPLYAEQQPSAFQMVKELGLAVELRLDYRTEHNELVKAEEIENAVNSLMDEGNPVRKRVQEMGQKSRAAVAEGGSSFNSIGSLIELLLHNSIQMSQ